MHDKFTISSIHILSENRTAIKINFFIYLFNLIYQLKIVGFSMN